MQLALPWANIVITCIAILLCIWVVLSWHWLSWGFSWLSSIPWKFWGSITSYAACVFILPLHNLPFTSHTFDYIVWISVIISSATKIFLSTTLLQHPFNHPEMSEHNCYVVQEPKIRLLFEREPLWQNVTSTKKFKTIRLKLPRSKSGPLRHQLFSAGCRTYINPFSVVESMSLRNWHLVLNIASALAAHPWVDPSQ